VIDLAELLSFPIICLPACLHRRLIDARKNYRGYIAMLAVKDGYRRCRIATTLVSRAIANMKEAGCDEAVLETEVTNASALNLYGNLGFVRDKRMIRYYLNGVDAFRLKLWLRAPADLNQQPATEDVAVADEPTHDDSASPAAK
jgi:hypothetical protein